MGGIYADRNAGGARKRVVTPTTKTYGTQTGAGCAPNMEDSRISSIEILAALAYGSDLVGGGLFAALA